MTRIWLAWSGAAIALAVVNLFAYGLLYGLVLDACRIGSCPIPWLSAFDVWLVVAGAGAIGGMTIGEWFWRP